MTTCKIDDIFKKLGIELPKVSKPIANYVPYTMIKHDKIVVSGQLPMLNGKLQYEGKLGRDLSVEEGYEAAKLCTLNMLAYLRENCGNLDRITQCIKLDIFVNSTEEFTEQASVANGASDLIVQIFGEKGKHARATVGVAQLPKGAAVEVAGFFEIEGK
jgi:enamine deaminase RidA (YjgF/YER057c/UK114 family)